MCKNVCLDTNDKQSKKIVFIFFYGLSGKMNIQNLRGLIMLTKKIAIAFITSSLLLSSVASFAAPPNDRDPEMRHAAQGPQGPNDMKQHRMDDRRDGPQGGPTHDNGPRPHLDWKKGDRVPRDYRSNSKHYVSDWKRHDLPAPPRGHRWLKINGDYVLVAIATGIIGSIVVANSR